MPSRSRKPFSKPAADANENLCSVFTGASATVLQHPSHSIPLQQAPLHQLCHTTASLQMDALGPAPTLRQLIDIFYDRVWNHRDDDALFAILSPNLRFRGSTESADRIGREAFKQYRDGIHLTLQDYVCQVQDVVVDASTAFARVWFSGVHSGGSLLGVPPTQRRVRWIGAARFALADVSEASPGMLQIGDVWVLGDLFSLQQQLQAPDRETDGDPENTSKSRN